MRPTVRTEKARVTWGRTENLLYPKSSYPMLHEIVPHTRSYLIFRVSTHTHTHTHYTRLL